MFSVVLLPQNLFFILLASIPFILLLFGGFFLAAYLSDLLGKNLLKRDGDTELNRLFVGYSMVVVFALEIVSGLFSISILHWILQRGWMNWGLKMQMYLEYRRAG